MPTNCLHSIAYDNRCKPFERTGHFLSEVNVAVLKKISNHSVPLFEKEGLGEIF
jgi:hypothetical protein